MADTGLLDEDVGPREKLHRSPRQAGAVALAKPDEVEHAQWCSSATFSSI